MKKLLKLMEACFDLRVSTELNIGGQHREQIKSINLYLSFNWILQNLVRAKQTSLTLPLVLLKEEFLNDK